MHYYDELRDSADRHFKDLRGPGMVPAEVRANPRLQTGKPRGAQARVALNLVGGDRLAPSSVAALPGPHPGAARRPRASDGEPVRPGLRAGVPELAPGGKALHPRQNRLLEVQVGRVLRQMRAAAGANACPISASSPRHQRLSPPCRACTRPRRRRSARSVGPMRGLPAMTGAHAVTVVSRPRCRSVDRSRP
jgi:hypothetical protein